MTPAAFLMAHQRGSSTSTNWVATAAACCMVAVGLLQCVNVNQCCHLSGTLAALVPSLYLVVWLCLQLCLEFMVNHVSPASHQFQDFIEHGDDSKYAEMFVKWKHIWPEGGWPTPASLECRSWQVLV